MHGNDAWRGASSSRAKTLAVLRSTLARIEAGHGERAASLERSGRFALGAPDVDAFLGGGLNRACLHEVQAPCGADWAAAVGFALALALRAAPRRPLLWARQDFLESEAGRLNGVGLAEFGADPAALSLVRGRDAEAVLRAAFDAARCRSLGAALIEIFGAPSALDLTTTLRLARAAEASGVTLFLLRIRVWRGEPGDEELAAQRGGLTLARVRSKLPRFARQCAGRPLFFRNVAAASRRRGRSFLAFGVAA